MRKAARKAAAAGLSGVPPLALAREALGLKGKRDESHYHKGSCAMRLIPDPDREGADPEEWDRIQPGDFWFGTEMAVVGATEHRYRVMYAKYPDGCMASLPLDMPDAVRAAGVRRASWKFDGNLERPTLTPSIHHIGHWHGYVRAGRMESV